MGFGFGPPLTKKEIRQEKREQRIKNRGIKLEKKALKARQRNSVRQDRYFTYKKISNLTFVFIGIVFLFVLLRVTVNSEFQFSLMGVLKFFQTIPTIDVVSLLTYEFNFPLWIAFLEPVFQFFSFIGACILNIFVVLFWFLRFLFVG